LTKKFYLSVGTYKTGTEFISRSFLQKIED